MNVLGGLGRYASGRRSIGGDQRGNDMYRLYRALSAALTPAARLWLAVHPKHKVVRPRLAPPLPDWGAGRPLLLHACSVGEYNTALPLYKAIRAALPDTPILLTLSTPTAYALAKEKSPEIPSAYFPLDFPSSVRHFLRSVQPLALVQVETEIWPNMFVEAQRTAVPIVIVNGRISDRHFPRYMRFRGALAPAFRAISAVGAQNERYAERFLQLGTPPEYIHITGNTKFDAVQGDTDLQRLNGFREALGLVEEGGPLVVFGSTRPGDEVLAAQCLKFLCIDFPKMRILIAPRHPQRAADAATEFSEEKILWRSETLKGQKAGGERVIFLDTLGELALAYACSDVAVVGGSFYPGVNGHNPLESAALGIATVFGPFMSNFEDAAVALLDGKAAVQVDHPDALPKMLKALLADTPRREKLGMQARQVIENASGAVEKNVALILDTLKVSAKAE